MHCCIRDNTGCCRFHAHRKPGYALGTKRVKFTRPPYSYTQDLFATDFLIGHDGSIVLISGHSSVACGFRTVGCFTGRPPIVLVQLSTVSKTQMSVPSIVSFRFITYCSLIKWCRSGEREGGNWSKTTNSCKSPNVLEIFEASGQESNRWSSRQVEKK